MKFLVYEIHLIVFIFQLGSFAQPDVIKNTDLTKQQLSIHWLENGLPYIQNFSPKDYNAEIQNFEIIQDSKGFIYSGNNIGVLIYDGVSWRVIQNSTKTAARTVTIINDTVYVGFVGDFGYLKPDSTGKLIFVSLKKYLPKDTRDFQDIYDIIKFNNAIYFKTRYLLLKFVNYTIKVVEFKNQIGDLLIFNNKFYLNLNINELYQLENDTLRFLLDADHLSVRHFAKMIPYNESKFLISTLEDGLFLSDGKKIERFPTEVDSHLKKHKIYDAVNLHNGLFGFATGRGAVILDNAGNLCQIVNKASGLRNDLVLDIISDKEGGLWLALNNGIARVETLSPISRFQDSNGLESFIEDIIRFKGKMYAASDRGVFYLDIKNFPFPQFKQVSGFSSLTFALAEVSGRLLAGTQGGIYEIKDAAAVKINDLPARYFYRSKIDTNLVYAGLIEGLAALKLVDNKWIIINQVQNYTDRITSIEEDEKGFLWLGTVHEGLTNAKVNILTVNGEFFQLEADFKRYTKKNGLPPGRKNPFFIDGRLVVRSTKGLKYFDKEKEYFFPDTTFGSVFADSSCENEFITKDKNNNIWIIAKKNEKLLVGKAILNFDGSYSWYNKPFLRINDLGNIYLIYPEEDGTVWFGGSEGLARYSPYFDKHYDYNYPAVIRLVKEVHSSSVLFNGMQHPGVSIPELENNSSLRFEFAALSFDDSPGNVFQYILEGYDNSWSDWSIEKSKEYTGLPAGDYKFKVRAKNIYNQISSEDIFAFTVSLPWYQQWWAYIIYIFSAAAVIFIFVKIRVHQLEKRTHRLEEIISKRTLTIREQTDKLKELDKIKSRLFANISHEFRTPLTLIIGISDKYLRTENRGKDDFKIIRKNAKRLLQLINQLLDLSKLESGSLKIEVQKTELNRFIIRIASSFLSLAEQKKLSFSLNDSPVNRNSEDKPLWIYIDQSKVESILYNLLANAIKFASEEGRVSVYVLHFSDHVEIKVTNTGKIIPPEHLDRIFDRFYQVEDKISENYEGTGIGLALVKELTELHKGKVAVESFNSETTFTLTFLLGKEHFSAEEILEIEEIKKDKIIEKIEPKVSNKKLNQAEVQEAESNIILVVEDHYDLRNFISEQLKSSYTIMEAEDGEKGVRLAEDMIPDLIISDIMMPKMNGYELCSKIKKNIKTNHIPVILLTAKASFENRLEGLETGADDYLIKPFNTQELKTRVKNLITIRQRMREKFCSEMIVKPAGVIVPSSQKTFIERLTSLIENHIEDENFSVENLSQEIRMSRVQLHRKIKAICNQSTSEFIRSYRLQRAAELIKLNAGNFTEIAYKVGFNSQAYFNKSFQKMFGITPGEFKKKNS